MRILVADHDSAMLEATARRLVDDFAVDVATSKLSCLAMLDVSEFHVIVACERLVDGSGLELLSQAGKRWPEVLRVLAIEPDRLPLLSGRLKPFRLFETVPYPLNPDKLRNVLMLAQAAEEAHVDTMNVQHIVLEDEVGAAAQQPVAATAARGRNTAAPNARARARSGAQQAGRNVAPQFTAPSGTGSGPAIPGAMNRRMGERRAGSERRGTISVSDDGDSFPDIDALAQASQIAASLRPKLDRAPNLFGTRRTTLFIAVGVGAAAVAAAAMMFGGGDSPGTATTPPVAILKSVEPAAAEPLNEGADADPARTASPPEGMTFDTAPTGAAAPMTGRSSDEPPEVVAFVADIESALTVDDFDRARSLLDTLRDVAPDYPRLAFFDALITRGEEMEALKAQRSGTNRVQAEVARAAAGTATRAPGRASEREVAARRQAAARTVAPPSPSGATADARSRPPVAPPEPSLRQAASAPVVASPPSNTFSGRTLEDSSRSGASPSGIAQPEADGLRRPAVVLPVVNEAKVVRQVDPEYPRDAMRDGVEGSIDLRFTVTADGKVADIEVVTADPPQTFDRAAISALRRWRYEPRREGGVAVDSRTRVRLEFKLQDTRRR